MSTRVFVISTGMISSIGFTVAECLKSLLSIKPGLGNVDLFDTEFKHYPTGEVKADDETLAKIAGLSYDKSLTRTTLLAAVAIQETLSTLNIDVVKNANCGLISGTTVGGMRRSECNYNEYFRDSSIMTHDCGDSTCKLSEIFDIRGFTTTISTACSSSANSLMLAARMISCGKLNIAIAGGTDSLTRFTMKGFNSLMILDKKHCMPFDNERAGINLGEGAAYLVLASEDFITKHKLNPICELTGWANTNDSFHQTASSPDGVGAFLSMSSALEKAGIGSKDIDYINAHGTGTQNNDLSEGIAIKRVFGENIPPFSSTKPFTGHTLGAAGAVEAVLSCLAISKDLVFPNLHFTNTIDELGMQPNRLLMRNTNVKNVLSNSFGFGGNNTSLIFSASN